jgi:hypothetical protein
MRLLRSRAASSRPRACTGSSKHTLAPCTLHALDSSLGSDARRSGRLASPRSTRSWRARRVECTCRVRRPDGRWAAHKRRPPIRLSPGLAHRPWLEHLAGERGASHCAPLQPWPWHQSPADEIEGVRVSLWHSAAGAIPAVEALALARRHARAVARAPALALRLGAVVTAHEHSPGAVQLPRAALGRKTSTSSSTFFDLNLRTHFRNRQISADQPPSTKHVAVSPSRTKVLRSILHTL